MSEDVFRWAQSILLGVNAVLVWVYIHSTRAIQKSAAEQARTAARQVEVSAQQAKLAEDQVEGASRPVITLHNVNSLNLLLQNIGNGPALNIKWWVWPSDDEIPGSLEAPDGRVGFIEAGKAWETSYTPAVLTNPPRKIICFYESVGGATYRTDFWIRRDSMAGVWNEHKFSRQKS